MPIHIKKRIKGTIKARNNIEIDEGTPIVRYIKLSTFLLLLAGKVFIPTLRLLQRGDQLENKVPEQVWANYAESLWIDLEPFERPLLDRETKSPSLPADVRHWIGQIRLEAPPDISEDFQKVKLLATIWLHELSIRRCVWCWNDCSEGPSEAMWTMYGNRGVAIKSKVGLVRKALEEAGVQRGIVAPLSYAIPRRAITEEAVARKITMLDRPNRPFPYLFKDSSYRFEEEIRFVFGTSPGSIFKADGVSIELDPRSFVEEVWVAPGTVETERRVIMTLWEDVKKQGRDLNYAPTKAEEHLNKFPFKDEPFSASSDDLDDLFKDLRP